MNVLKNRLDKQQSVNQQIIGVGPLTIKAILEEAKMHPMSTSVAMLVAEICNIVNFSIDTEYYIDKYFDIKDGTDIAKEPPIYHKGTTSAECKPGFDEYFRSSSEAV